MALATMTRRILYTLCVILSYWFLAAMMRVSYAHWGDCWAGGLVNRGAFCYYYPDQTYHVVSCDLLSPQQQQEANCPVTGYSLQNMPHTNVEFLMLREGLCRTGWVEQDGAQTIVTDLTLIPCPVEELRGYLP